MTQMVKRAKPVVMAVRLPDSLIEQVQAPAKSQEKAIVESVNSALQANCDQLKTR